eukprot:349956-Chlamydomonas_euryale.AAC.2
MARWYEATALAVSPSLSCSPPKQRHVQLANGDIAAVSLQSSSARPACERMRAARQGGDESLTRA